VYQALGRDSAREAGRSKPIDVLRSVTIGATPEVISSALAAPETWLAGLPRIDVRREYGGIRLEVKLPWLGRRSVQLEAVESADGTLLWRTKSDSWLLVEARAELVAAPGERGCELRIRAHASATSLFGDWLIRPWLSAVSGRAIGVALTRLKQLVETGEVATSRTRAVCS
jgi:hypothetical protein